MKDSHGRPRCGIVLAGGKGAQLRAFVRQVKGSSIPKQYVNFIGTRSMIEHSFDRAERLIRRDRLFTVVTRDHLRHPEVQGQLSRRAKGTVIVQPEDRDTGPAILLALMHVCKSFPGSTVAIFPADHFVLEEDLFMAQIAMAFYLVESHRSQCVVLGIEPETPDADYGYIISDGEARDLAPSGARNIRLFVESPGATLAAELIAADGLWNTMTMVFHTDGLLDIVRRLAPALYNSFQEVEKAIGTSSERAAVEQTYRRVRPVNFAKDILEKCALLNPSPMSVLPVAGVFWSDCGSESRIVDALRRASLLDRLQKNGEARLS